MSKAILEFVIDVEADETFLQTLKTSLTEADSPLVQTLIEVIQEKLGEVSDSEIEAVKLPGERVAVRTTFDGGLNAQEWMNKSDVTTSAVKEDIKEQGFQD